MELRISTAKVSDAAEPHSLHRLVRGFSQFSPFASAQT
jgi:hypothetical protein